MKSQICSPTTTTFEDISERLFCHEGEWLKVGDGLELWARPVFWIFNRKKKYVVSFIGYDGCAQVSDGNQLITLLGDTRIPIGEKERLMLEVVA